MRSLGLQALVLLLVFAIVFFMVAMTVNALEARGINIGIKFLFEEAGFRIAESVFDYQPTDNILQAILAGFANTIKVSFISIIAATLIGLLIGVGQMSANPLISAACTTYVAVFRNTPQLVQISFFYLLVTRLPGPRQALDLGGLGFLSNRGLAIAWLADTPETKILLLVFAVSVVAALVWLGFVRSYRRRTGVRLPGGWGALALIAVPVLFTWLVLGMPSATEIPALKGFNFRGGLQLSSEFLTLFMGLSLYIAAFIAEIVRSGIQATTKGQIEAAQSIGLDRYEMLTKIILPQAMRVMMPPLTAQYVSLTKNSSLGVMIGYPELFNISSTALTLSGHVVECLAIMAGMYLFISLLISALGNTVNYMFRIRER
jgi:general L-amino acid transport system permease protein